MLERNSAVIVDLDGTLANCQHRVGILEEKGDDRWDRFYDQCDRDQSIPWVINLVNELYPHHRIIIMTGRPERIRGKTAAWLGLHNVSYDALFMRKDGDHRHDSEVKPELMGRFHELFPGHWVQFIIEDRNSMVKKWRELQYQVLQCAEGDF